MSIGTAATPHLQKSNPLLKYTLQGEAAELEKSAISQKPLLGSFCMTGQCSVVCAPPNAGKTLITIATLIEAIDEGRIDGHDVFYVNADDTTQGVVDKLRVLDEYGVHVVAEGYKGFKSRYLAAALEEMIEGDTAHGKFLILDTFKKFTQPMKKPETSEFLAVLRRFILNGGTVLCLAHVNKNQDANGRNVFAGVSDIIDDTDCAYVLDVRSGPEGKRVVQMTNKKRRGNNPDLLAYAYSPDPELSYLERLASVHETDPQGETDEAALDYQTDEEDIVYSLAMNIHHGPDRGKMVLVRAVADHLNVSKRRVLKVLEDGTGEDAAVHRWRYVVRARGLHAFELLGPVPDPPA